ncbi:hypothetical protein [Metamycoplasma hominis]|uniref:hypothetical protein n=1 Tax=Metamycoplasma hominis TaxID=2098 RepID=UPI001E568EED|nr:hypothetical protein [Metamycoplasma hominis]
MKRKKLCEIENMICFKLRKVSWSALSPYQLQINRRFRSMDIEMSIINLKLNMIINALFKDNGDLEKQIDNHRVIY